MTRPARWLLPRRHLIRMAAAAPVALAAPLPFRLARAQALSPTPACDDDPTPPNPLGPFHTPSSPRRVSLLEPGDDGRRLVLEGTVLTTDCRPVPGAVLDFWHTDAQGAYDNRGFRYRGHVVADGEGRWRLETILPGEYPGRTRHIHLIVAPPGGRSLTTQLYFPGEPRNASDPLYHPELELAMAGGSDEARFDVVLADA